jgi:hypothetical protein
MRRYAADGGSGHEAAVQVMTAQGANGAKRGALGRPAATHARPAGAAWPEAESAEAPEIILFAKIHDSRVCEERGGGSAPSGKDRSR